MEFLEKTVSADGFDIRYWAAGDGEPLVYLHGANGLRISPGLDMLARDHRVIAFEQPGFGDSAVNETTRDLGGMAAIMRAAIAAAGISECALMGHSLGGKLALTMAAQDPEPFTSLVLIASAAMRTPDAPWPSDVPPADLPALLYAHPENFPMEPPPPEVREKQVKLVERLKGPPRDAAFEELAAGVELPVLAVFGVEDGIIYPECADYHVSVLPNCHAVMIYDAGHSPDTERPEAVVSVVADFLRRHEKFLVTEKSGVLYP